MHIYCMCVCCFLTLFLICASVCTLLNVWWGGFDSFNQRCVVKRHGGSVSLFFPQIKLCVSMPVTYLIWDAALSSLLPTLTAPYYPPVWGSLHLRRREIGRRRYRGAKDGQEYEICLIISLSLFLFEVTILKMTPLSASRPLLSLKYLFL